MRVNIGERIRTLRAEKKMTQSELAGLEITRNMLSRIENDAALPSVPTLLYLAKRLGVPAGMLLAENEEMYRYRKEQSIRDIKRAYLTGDYRICREICRTAFAEPDDEIWLILTACDVAIGREEFLAGNLQQSSIAFAQALSDAQKTAYPTGELTAGIPAVFRYLAALSPTYAIPRAEKPSLSPFAGKEEDKKMELFLLWLEKRGEATAFLQFPPHDPYRRVIEAEIFAGDGNHQAAAARFGEVLSENETLPPVLLLEIYTAMEISCREIGDFKGAYECVSARTKNLAKLLQKDRQEG